MIQRHSRMLAAFSLIEVLISVLVLALGLLGLGAMFPVIIRQQRQATDATVGTMAANAARLELESNGIFRGEAAIPGTAGGPIGDPTPMPPWSVVLDRLLASPSTRTYLAAPTYDGPTGMMSVGEGASIANIPMASRLFPSPSPTGVQPRYIWDLVYRAVGNDRLEVFIIVRPIDPNIRIKPGLTLSDVLAPQSDAGELFPPTKLAVSASRSSLLPLLDGSISGTSEYSKPVEMRVESGIMYDDSSPDLNRHRNRISLKPSGSTEKALASTILRTGQKIIDRKGTIYTVVGVPQSSAYEVTVLVDPPIPGSIEDSTDLGPVYFVPQTPASVTKVTIIP